MMSHDERRLAAIRGWETTKGGEFIDVCAISLSTRSDEPKATRSLQTVAHAFSEVFKAYDLTVPQHFAGTCHSFLFGTQPKRIAELRDERGLPVFQNIAWRAKGQPVDDLPCLAQLVAGFTPNGKWLANAPTAVKRSMSLWPYAAADFLAADLKAVFDVARSRDDIVFAHEGAKAVPFVKRGPLTIADMQTTDSNETRWNIENAG